MEREKEEALQREKASLNEKLEMSEKEKFELQNIGNDVDRLEIEPVNEELKSFQGMALRTTMASISFFYCIHISLSSYVFSTLDEERVQIPLVIKCFDEAFTPEGAISCSITLHNHNLREFTFAGQRQCNSSFYLYGQLVKFSIGFAYTLFKNYKVMKI